MANNSWGAGALALAEIGNARAAGYAQGVADAQKAAEKEYKKYDDQIEAILFVMTCYFGFSEEKQTQLIKEREAYKEALQSIDPNHPAIKDDEQKEWLSYESKEFTSYLFHPKVLASFWIDGVIPKEIVENHLRIGKDGLVGLIAQLTRKQIRDEEEREKREKEEKKQAKKLAEKERHDSFVKERGSKLSYFLRGRAD